MLCQPLPKVSFSKMWFQFMYVSRFYLDKSDYNDCPSLLRLSTHVKQTQNYFTFKDIKCTVYYFRKLCKHQFSFSFFYLINETASHFFRGLRWQLRMVWWVQACLTPVSFNMLFKNKMQQVLTTKRLTPGFFYLAW